VTVNKTVWIFFTGIWHWNWRRRKWPCLWLDGYPDHRALQPSPQGQQWAASRVVITCLTAISLTCAKSFHSRNGSRRPHSRSLVRLFLSLHPPCSQQQPLGNPKRLWRCLLHGCHRWRHLVRHQGRPQLSPCTLASPSPFLLITPLRETVLQVLSLL